MLSVHNGIEKEGDNKCHVIVINLYVVITVRLEMLIVLMDIMSNVMQSDYNEY